MTEHTIRVRIGGQVATTLTFQAELTEDGTPVDIELDGRNLVGIQFDTTETAVGHWPDGEEWVRIETLPASAEEIAALWPNG